MDDHPVHTRPNHHHTKMDDLPKTFVKIILAAKWLVRHSSTSLRQQRRPLPSLLSISYFYAATRHIQYLCTAVHVRIYFFVCHSLFCLFIGIPYCLGEAIYYLICRVRQQSSEKEGEEEIITWTAEHRNGKIRKLLDSSQLC